MPAQPSGRPAFSDPRADQAVNRSNESGTQGRKNRTQLGSGGTEGTMSSTHCPCCFHSRRTCICSTHLPNQPGCASSAHSPRGTLHCRLSTRGWRHRAAILRKGSMYVRLKIPNIMRQVGRCLEGPDQSWMSLHRGAIGGKSPCQGSPVP